MHHGEDEVEVEDIIPNGFSNEEYVCLGAGSDDAIGHPLFDIDSFIMF